MDLPASQDLMGELEMESNSSLTCLESTLLASNESLLPPTVEETAKVVVVFYDVVLIALGIPLSSLILFLFIQFRKLRDVSFTIAFQIASANLFLAVLKIPEVINHVAGLLLLGLNFCIFDIVSKGTLLYARNCLIFVFSLDRFASVFAPFNYPKYSYRGTITMSVISWSIAFANAVVLSPPGLDCYGFDQAELSCKFLSSCNRNCQLISYILLSTHLIPVMVIPVGFFIALYLKGRSIRRRENEMFGLGRNMSEQDWKALKTFSWLLSGVFLLTFPASVLLVVSSHFPPVAENLILKITPAVYSTLIITDPIIILRNADVREVLRTLMNRWKSVCCKLLKNSTRSSNSILLEAVSGEAK